MNLTDLLWLKACPIPGYDRDVVRYDYTFRLIIKDHFGRRDSEYGWEKGHIIARCEGGSDEYSNLQPEHWRTNMQKEADRKQALASSLTRFPSLATDHDEFYGLASLASTPSSNLCASVPSYKFGESLKRLASNDRVHRLANDYLG